MPIVEGGRKKVVCSCRGAVVMFAKVVHDPPREGSARETWSSAVKERRKFGRKNEYIVFSYAMFLEDFEPDILRLKWLMR
jgi:hypothetical protein